MNDTSEARTWAQEVREDMQADEAGFSALVDALNREEIEALEAARDWASEQAEAQRAQEAYWLRSYHAYAEACEAEGLTPHSRHMWMIHGAPMGPV